MCVCVRALSLPSERAVVVCVCVCVCACACSLPSERAVVVSVAPSRWLGAVEGSVWPLASSMAFSKAFKILRCV